MMISMRYDDICHTYKPYRGTEILSIDDMEQNTSDIIRVY